MRAQSLSKSKNMALSPMVRSNFLGQDSVSFQYTKKAQGIAADSHKKILEDLEQQIQNCKRENYATEEEYQMVYRFLIERYKDVQESMNNTDTKYTKNRCRIKSRTIG